MRRMNRGFAAVGTRCCDANGFLRVSGDGVIDRLSRKRGRGEEAGPGDCVRLAEAKWEWSVAHMLDRVLKEVRAARRTNGHMVTVPLQCVGSLDTLVVQCLGRVLHHGRCLRSSQTKPFARSLGRLAWRSRIACMHHLR